MELLARTVRRVATPDDLQLPGDYCQTDHLETGGEICHSIIINCAFCGTANAVILPRATFLERMMAYFKRARGMTIDSTIACYGNPERHRFSVRDGFIIQALVSR